MCIRDSNNPMPLHFAVHIFIIQLFRVIREPIIIDRKQTEERGLSGSLTAYILFFDNKVIFIAFASKIGYNINEIFLM